MGATAQAVDDTDAAPARLQGVVAALDQWHLHRAHRDGGWSVAGVVSHINVCTVIWLGDLARLRADPEGAHHAVTPLHPAARL
jgi:uncharacterized damage-inducible protein DinB